MVANSKDKQVASHGVGARPVLVVEHHEDPIVLAANAAFPTMGAPYIRVLNEGGGAAVASTIVGTATLALQEGGSAVSIPDDGSALVDVRGLTNVSFGVEVTVLRTW